MKKLFTVAAIALGTLTSLNAQEIDFGVQAGLNLATFAGDDSDGADGRAGINVGLTGEYEFNENFGILIGAIYSQQGAEYDELGTTTEIKLDYINVPVLAKFYLGGSGLAIEAGPQIGFIVNDEFDTNVPGVNGDLEAETIDLSAGGGLSYKFREGTVLEGVSLGARYMFGLTNVYDDNDVSIADDLTNSVFSINLGYKF